MDPAVPQEKILTPSNPPELAGAEIETFKKALFVTIQVKNQRFYSLHICSYK